MKFKKIILFLFLIFQFTTINAVNKDSNNALGFILRDDARSLTVFLDKLHKKNDLIIQKNHNTELLIAALLLQKNNVIAMFMNRPIDINASIVIDSCSRKNGWQTKQAYEIFCDSSTNLSNAFSEMTVTPLQATCLTGDLTAMKILIKAGANINSQAEDLSLIESCLATKKFNQVAFLIDEGANVRAENLNLSPIMALSSVSADQTDQSLAKMLAEKMIAKGADPYYIAKTHYTELHAAAAAGNLAIVKLLVELGVDINAKTDSGSSPLRLADKNNRSAVVDYLMSKGAKK